MAITPSRPCTRFQRKFDAWAMETKMLTKETTAAVVKKFGANDKNTGSTEVQIALITEKIKALAPHFEKNKKDHSGMRGLMKIIGQRRSLLKHLSKTDEARYTKILAELGLRK